MSAELARKFADAIQAAVNEVAVKHGGEMNSVLGALVSVQGYLIAGLPNASHRQAAIDSVCRTLPLQVEDQRRDGQTARAMSIVNGRGPQPKDNP